MSESKTAKKAILDKFRQILVFFYQRRPKKMSENAERPAKSGRGSGKKERPTAPSVRSRPRIGQEGAADIIFVAAFSENRTGLPELANLSYFSSKHPPREGAARHLPRHKN